MVVMNYTMDLYLFHINFIVYIEIFNVWSFEPDVEHFTQHDMFSFVI